jgi:ribosome-associated protein
MLLASRGAWDAAPGATVGPVGAGAGDDPDGVLRGVLRVTPTCRIPLAELEWRVSRSGGPGGQHANTADTRVEVRFSVADSAALGPRQRARLLERLGPVVRAVAADTRSQTRNRTLALERLAARLAAGLAVTPPRRPTRPSGAARARRLDDKRHQARRKEARRRPPAED